ncbi:hypothetical protein BRC80_04190, partial [Halobacteriales archaeon QH_9_66_26]
ADGKSGRISERRETGLGTNDSDGGESVVVVAVEVPRDGGETLVGRFGRCVDRALARFANAIEESGFDDVDRDAPTQLDPRGAKRGGRRDLRRGRRDPRLRSL